MADRSAKKGPDEPAKPVTTGGGKPGDQFLKMAREWGLVHSDIIDCRRAAVSDRDRRRIHHLAFNLMIEVRRRRPDLDVRPLAELSFLDFHYPPSEGVLTLLDYDAGVLIGTVVEDIVVSSRAGAPPPPVDTGGASISAATKEQILARLEEYQRDHPRATCIPGVVGCLLANKEAGVSDLKTFHRPGTDEESIARTVRKARKALGRISIKIQEKGRGKDRVFWLEEFPAPPR